MEWFSKQIIAQTGHLVLSEGESLAQKCTGKPLETEVLQHGVMAFDHALHSEMRLLNAHVCQGYINSQHNPPA